MATLTCFRSVKRSSNLRRTQFLCSSLLGRTEERSGVTNCFARLTTSKNSISRAKVPPANGPPGERYAFGPMRISVFRPRSTSLASAPTNSQIAAISFANVTETAKNELIACLVISADSTDIHSILFVIGSSSRSSLRWASSVRTPTTIRSGFKKTSSALPSRRFSGEYAKLRRLFA